MRRFQQPIDIYSVEEKEAHEGTLKLQKGTKSSIKTPKENPLQPIDIHSVEEYKPDESTLKCQK